MNLRTMHSEVEGILQQRVPLNSFYLTLIGAVRRINAETYHPDVLVKITNTGGYTITIEDMLEGAVSQMASEATYRIANLDWIDGIEVDGTNYCVTLPATWIKVLAVYLDDVKMEPVPYDILRAAGDDNLYTSINRNLYFNKDFSGLANVIKLRCRILYELPILGQTEYSGMPESSVQLLTVACVYSLLSRPQYFNNALYGIYANQYAELMSSLSMENMTRRASQLEVPVNPTDPTYY